MKIDTFKKKNSKKSALELFSQTPDNDIHTTAYSRKSTTKVLSSKVSK